jgi:hypothetical protein
MQNMIGHVVGQILACFTFVANTGAGPAPASRRAGSAVNFEIMQVVAVEAQTFLWVELPGFTANTISLVVVKTLVRAPIGYVRTRAANCAVVLLVVKRGVCAWTSAWISIEQVSSGVANSTKGTH